MKYYVLQPDYLNPTLARIEKSPELPFEEYLFDDCVSLVNQFPQGVEYHLSEFNPLKNELLSIIEVGSKLLIINDDIKSIFQLFEPSIEFLPITVVDHNGVKHLKQYYIANIIKSVDCVDLELSDFQYCPIEKERFILWNKIVFNYDNLTEAHNIFKVPQLSTSYFISEEVKNRLENATDISGYKLIPLENYNSWSF